MTNPIIFRGTTPFITLNVQGAQLDGRIYCTIAQDKQLVTKANEDMEIIPGNEGTLIKCSLSQRDTLRFKPGFAQVQLRWVLPNGTAFATPIATIEVAGVLKDGVI